MVSAYLYVDCCSVIWEMVGLLHNQVCCSWVSRDWCSRDECTWNAAPMATYSSSLSTARSRYWERFPMHVSGHFVAALVCAECRHFCPSVQFDIAWLKLRMLGIESSECRGGIMGYYFDTYKTWGGRCSELSEWLRRHTTERVSFRGSL